MRFVIDEVEYGVRFAYDRIDDVDHHVITHCFISRVDPTKKGRERYLPITSASTVNNPKYDMFVRATGRKLALDRAINRVREMNCMLSPHTASLSTFSDQMMKKSNRKIVWDAFLNPVVSIRKV